MWQIVKAEIEYNRYSISVMVAFILIYAVIVISATRILTGTDLDAGPWGIIFLLPLYIIFYSILNVPTKERRNRMFTLLPVRHTVMAMSKFVFVQFLFTSILLCILLILAITYPMWLEDADNILFQLGGGLIILSIIIGCLDVWYIPRDNLVIKISVVTAFLISVLIPTILVFLYLRPVFYDVLGIIPGKILYLLWGSILLYVTTKTYVKRKSFLS